MFERIQRIRRELHQIPELELSLPMTKAYLISQLQDLPVSSISRSKAGSRHSSTTAVRRPSPFAATWMPCRSPSAAMRLTAAGMRETCMPADMTALLHLP